MAKNPKMNWDNIFIHSKQGGTGTQIGNFKESTGGGTPMEKGQKIDYVADTPKEASEYRRDHPGALVRVSQPRDKDGQFTYNSANKKELEYGPSRGKTVPPFMKGWEISFSKKTGKGTFIADSGKKYIMPDTVKSADEFIKSFMEFHKDDNGGSFGAFGLGDTAKGKGGKMPTNTIKITSSDISTYAKQYGQQAKNMPNTFSKKKGTPNTPPTDQKPNTTRTLDRSLAQSDPKKFIQDNYDEIQSIADMAKNKGMSLNVDGMVKAFADGDIDSFDEVKKALEEA